MAYATLTDIDGKQQPGNAVPQLPAAQPPLAGKDSIEQLLMDEIDRMRQCTGAGDVEDGLPDVVLVERMLSSLEAVRSE